MDKTISVPGRVDICSLATLARAYETEGMRLRSKSDLIWQAVEQLARLYSGKHKTEPFTDIADAVDYMESIDLPLVTNKRAAASVRRASTNQNLEQDFNGSEVGFTSKKQLMKEDKDENRQMYNLAARLIREKGGRPISFEQFMENKRRDVEDTDIETVDEAAFAEKEEAKRAAMKAGLSFVPTSVDSITSVEN